MLTRTTGSVQQLRDDAEGMKLGSRVLSLGVSLRLLQCVVMITGRGRFGPAELSIRTHSSPSW